MSRRRVSTWAGALLGTMLLGCQTIHQPTEADYPTLHAACLSDEATIGPEGGTMSCGPYTLTVPQGAVSVPVAMRMDQVSCGQWPVELSPDGTQFMVPVTLSFDAAGEPDPGSMDVHWWNPKSGDWEVQPTAHQGTTCSAELSHFSRYIII